MRRSLFALLLLLIAIPALTQPASPVRMCAEWEPVEGVMIRWPLGIPTGLVAEMSEDALIYLILSNSHIPAAMDCFENAGVNMDNVRWFVADSFSHWSRDWGPQIIFDGNGDWGIGDPWFDGYPWIPRGGGRGYFQDDDTPAQFAAYLGEPLWQPPFYLTGGNFMNDGHGGGFCSEAQLSENDHLSEAEFRLGVSDWFGIEALNILPNTEAFGIQHIDCLAKLLDEETIIVKQVSPSHDDYEAIEENVAILSTLTNCYGRPYRILRVDCGPFGGVGTAAYTNSLILGKKVLVPFFDCSGDEPARQLMAEALPGYEVIGFSGDWYYFDALHCRTMGIFDRGMLRVDIRPPDPEIPALDLRLRAFIDDRSETGLVPEACLLRWRLAGEADFQQVQLLPIGGDSLEAWIPAQAPGSEIELYVTATDHSGRVETRPIAAPVALYRCVVSDDLTAASTAWEAAGLRVWPTPFTTELRFSRGAEDGDVEIFDVRGRLVRRLSTARGQGVWNGLDMAGRPVSAGLYFARAAGGASAPVKVLKLR